ncbi:MAG: GAF domain-containing protein, partial [Deltaproteobacteria bacterium]|nr:GAF domain-containing protein [Deltaproteobacteria bacterium]
QDPALIEHFVILGRNGQRLTGPALPFTRLLQGERFEEAQVWLAPPGHPLHLRVRSDGLRLELLSLGARPLLELGGRIASLLVRGDTLRLAEEQILGELAYALGAEALAVLVSRDGRLGLESGFGLWQGLESPRLEADLDDRHSLGGAALARLELDLPVEDLVEPWALAVAECGMRRVRIGPLHEEGEPARVLVVARRSGAPMSEEEQVVLAATCRAWGDAFRLGRGREVETKARSGMRALAEVALERRSEPPLRELLRLLVGQACELIRARYGAMGVLNRERSELADFVTVGVSDEQAARIGHLPQGRGLLGEVIRQGRTLRMADLSRHPSSAGFPAHHPQMRSFLGVPLRLGQEVFGNFYLSEKEDGAEFTEDDARLLEAFSAQAALTVAYARDTGEQRRLLDAVLRQAPHGIVFFGSPDVIAFSNAAARRLLGLPREGPVRRSYRLLRPDGDPLPFVDYPGMRALGGETVESLEVKVARADGSELPAFVNAAPVRSETGVLLGAVVAYQDLTPFKELERVREEFSAVVAHDLRSPLQTMLLQLETLLRGALGGEEVRAPVETLQRMKRSGLRLQHLIGDLLDAARIEGGRVLLDPRPVQMPALVSGLVQQLEPALGAHPVRTFIDGSSGAVLADVVRIEQVLTNLVENAAKYSPEGALIEITVSEARGGATVAVRDRGAGIAAEDLPRLFDRYYQTSRARQKRSGLGLGLFIAKGLVEAHHGRLWVESVPGAGSTFYLWLPEADEGLAVSPGSPPGPSPSS